jgi:16S rRNA A1518/A1519 N6-dimethyltransferase RsmA/KsgA/DIM1 with predicted DNA glycosylase/AP lyase activity
VAYQPDLYDIVTASQQSDVDWYCQKARTSGGPVLELGAGTGRVTLAMAREGVPVCALDLDSRMLGRLRSKIMIGRW